MDDDDNDAFAAAVVVYERVLQYLVWLVRSFSKLRPERNVHNNLDKWVHQKKCTRRPILLHRHVVQLACHTVTTWVAHRKPCHNILRIT